LFANADAIGQLGNIYEIGQRLANGTLRSPPPFLPVAEHPCRWRLRHHLAYNPAPSMAPKLAPYSEILQGFAKQWPAKAVEDAIRWPAAKGLVAVRPGCLLRTR